MDYTTPPVTAGQIADFLEDSLEVLRQLYTCRMTVDGMAALFDNITDGMYANEDEYRRLREEMIPEVVHADETFREILESPGAQYMLKHLPLRYCWIPTLMWLIPKHRRHPFADLSAAFRAADRSPTLFLYNLRTDSRNRLLYQKVQNILETWLKDHPTTTAHP